MKDAPLPCLARSGARKLAVRFAVSSVQVVRRAIWYFTQPRSFGVRAIVLTSSSTIVLVRHSYTRGWWLPGGARARDEDRHAAMLRELREEIGLRAHGALTELAEFSSREDRKHDTVTLFVLRDAEYRPRLSLEIEAIAEFPVDRLPPDATADTAHRVAEFLARERA